VRTAVGSFLYANGECTIGSLLNFKKPPWQEDIGKDPRYSVTTGISAAAELRIEIELLPAHHFLTVGDLLCTINVGRSTGGSSKCMYSDKFPEVSNWCSG
jgi:hypothetical protein